VSRLPSWDLCLTNYPLSSCYFATAHHLRGCIYFDNFFYESALFDFQHAEEIDKNNPVLYYDLGCIYKVLDDVEKSEICTFKALELYPDFIFGLDILFNCHKKKNNFVECLKFLNKIIELNPDYIPAYNAILRIQEDESTPRKKQKPTRRLSFESETSKVFNWTMNLNNNSVIQRTQEILSKRIPFELCHQKAKFFFDSKTTLPSDSFEQKDFQKLISFYTQKLHESKSKEEASEFYHLRGCIYFDNIHYECALFDFQHAEEIDTNNPVLYYDLGCLFQALRDVEMSEIYANKSLKLFPNFVFALDLLAYCKKKKNQYQEHLNLMNRCIQLNPDYLPAYSSIMKQNEFIDVDSYSKISVNQCYAEILRINKEMKPMIYKTTYCTNIRIFSEYLNEEECMKYMNSCIEIYPGIRSIS
jgi:tetratricopeptide (TPR) repeat protein